MSTVMYAYRVPGTQLWPFLDSLRAHYREQGMAHRAMRQIVERSVELGTAYSYERAKDLAGQADLEVTVQLFQDGDTWLLRVLESSYWFLNHWEHFAAAYGIEPVFYDDRADMPEADLPNKAIAERMDALITARRYLLAVVVDADELINYFFETRSTP